MSPFRANDLPGSRLRENPCGRVDFRAPQRPLAVGGGSPALPPSRRRRRAKWFLHAARHPTRDARKFYLRAVSKALCPPAQQAAAGGAEPGEVRAVDLPLVAP